jgi:hypothetical protein
MTVAGRSCPVRYRYGAAAIAAAPERWTETLYVVGNLYGNRPALAAVEALAAAESRPVTLCFNGDFNWFNVDRPGFVEVNSRVLAHDAICGNVEAELDGSDGDAGCGCAYPASVDDGVVERSNAIYRQLSGTAQTCPELLARLSALPMFARYRVGDLRIAVVHGDLGSLAGWGFDAATIDRPECRAGLREDLALAKVEVAACSHTCLPVCRMLGSAAGDVAVINNGAAGMPNFAGTRYGILTRIATHPAPHPTLYGLQSKGVHLDALAVPYDHAAWLTDFLANWPPGSEAHRSYYGRIVAGPGWHLSDAAPRTLPRTL